MNAVKTRGRGTEDRRQKSAGAAKRSLAAHKANWTRAVRKAFPKGDTFARPPLATYTADELDRELLTRAIARAAQAIAATEASLFRMRDKQAARQIELANRYETMRARQKGGAS